MKISTEQLRIQQENELKRGARQEKPVAFDAVLNRELGEADPAQSGALSETPSGVARPLLPGAEASLGIGAKALAGTRLDAGIETGGKDPDSLAEEVRMFEGMLGSFEDYAEQLALEDRADLRNAFSSLQNVRKQLEDFKTRFAASANEAGAAAELLNEMDVLATTEIIKFNRGDYLG
ncbi:MAG: hypothetical protein LBN33_03335 [Desulfovibrio sp.]|jgi:hypothetical protein|nr:hypothetical protein [Desulfovibrio sp.]